MPTSRWPALLLLGIALLSLGASPATLPAPSHAGLYTDPVYGFSMTPPNLGEIKQERAVITIFQAPPEEGFIPNVTVMVDPGATDLESYVTAWRAAMKETNPRANLRSYNVVQVSGKPAGVLDYDFTVATRRLRFLQLVVIDSERVFVVTCTAPLESWDKYHEQFQKCVDSFKLDRAI